MKNYFVIFSYGRTATQWITKALNMHSDIYCSHGPDYGDGKSASASEEDERERLDLIQKRMNKFTKSMDLDEYFDRIETIQKGKSFYGNIHGILPQRVFTRLRPFKRKYNFINVVRHPVKRVESMKNRLLHVSSGSEFLKQQYENMFLFEKDTKMMHRLVEKFDVDFSKYDNRIFFLAVQLLEADLVESSLPVPHLQMERITADIEYFLYFLKKITGGKLKLSDSYIRDVALFGKVDERGSNMINSSFDQFEQWEEWKKWLFLKTIDKLKLFKVYDNYGYDLSYCINSVSKSSGSLSQLTDVNDDSVSTGKRNNNVINALYCLLSFFKRPKALGGLFLKAMKRRRFLSSLVN
ncbi:MAG: hypothetical protein OEV42_00325 [Deltaproteobacteria bacterium]|nr:hypothetical protein [Deltaproteobacteria bacterium]